MLYAPLAPISGEMLTRDPFLLTLQWAQCLAPPAPGRAGQSVLVSGALEQSAFRIDVQDGVVAAFDAWRLAWPDVQSCTHRRGVLRRRGRAPARAEIGLIGGVSAIAILMLLFVCFRRPEAIVGTLAVTAAGAAGSLAAALLLFPSVHVLVFVFGSALIGVTSDYALHYLATGPQTGWAPPAERVKRVARPLAVCALSTALGFASLGLFGVAIFNQVAVFSVAGILTAWWFTMTLLPLMDQRARAPEKLSAWWNRLEKPFLAFQWTKAHTFGGLAFVGLIVVIGVARFSVLDDVRQFQPRSTELAADEAQIREALGFSSSPVFLMSYGADAQEARRREEAALAAWPEDSVRDVLALSRFDPSATRRALNEETLRTQLYDPHLPARIAELGLEDAAPFATGEPPALPAMLADLEGEGGGVHYLVAPLRRRGGHGDAACRRRRARG